MSVQIGVLLNESLDIKARQTSAMLMHGITRRGHQGYVFGVADLMLAVEGEVTAWARPIPVAGSVPEMLAALPSTTPVELDLRSLGAVMIRTSPGRDQARAWAHETALGLLRLASERGLVVLNSPDGLRRASSKLYLSSLPVDVRPETMVSRDPAALKQYVTSRSEPTVLKPLLGTRGTDVFMLRPDDKSNINQIIDVLTRDGYAMAQAFVPEAIDGDTRVVMLEGEPLMVGDHVAAIRRVPGGGDFRSNVHVGGTPVQGVLTEAAAWVARAIGPRLRRDGLFLVGMDLIGGKLIELNVFSPGGLFDAERFCGVSFVDRIIEAMEARVSEHADASRPPAALSPIGGK